MRIVHTADWHLCDQLGKLDRTADLTARVERVAALCEAHAADVLLIAGDLFYERATDDDIAAALKHLTQAFTPFFERGGTILAVTGNHDDDGKIDLVRRGLFLASPLSSGGVFQRGRMYLQNGLTFGRLGDAQFVLVPYPRAVRYELPDDYRTREQEHALLRDRLTTWLTAEVFGKPGFDPHLPTVLVAHLHVRGANVNQSLFRMSDADEVMVEQAVLQHGWAYAALGHIHLAQAVGGVETVRYPGPLDRLDFGEKTNDCGVLLFDLGPTGLVAPPTRLPLDPTPFHDITIADPDAELPGLAEKYPDRDTAIVRIAVENDGVALGRDEIGRKLKSLFPRLHQLKFPDHAPGDAKPVPGADDAAQPFADRVRAYLADVLQDDADRDAVLALAETFLAAESPEAAR